MRFVLTAIGFGLTGLATSGMVSAETELDSVKAQRSKESLEYARATFKLAIAHQYIARSEIKAPWAGVVDRVIRHTGEWVQQGDPVPRDVGRIVMQFRHQAALPERV